MSSFLDYKFTPAMVDSLLSAAPTLLRNWRMRGHLESIGEPQGGGRWLYNGSDLTKMAIVLIFQRERVDLTDAFQFAERIDIDVLVQLFDLDYDGISARFTSFLRGSDEGKLVAYKVREAAHLDVSAPITTVVDARAIAKEIPDALKSEMPVPTSEDLNKLFFSRQREV